MSTRSYVGIIKDGKVKYGYHHSDSHLESLGIDLYESIKTRESAFAEIENFASMNYGGEISRESFFSTPSRDIYIEFCYGFDLDDEQWYVSSCHFSDEAQEHKLTEVVKNDEEMKCYANMYCAEYQESIIKRIQENIS